jgi:N-acylglucosamine 2-epimerase
VKGTDWQALAEQYRSALLEDVIPFWLRHSLDGECGGFLSHLDRDGSPFGTNKLMYLHGREVWTFSRLCNELEPRDEWLAAARAGAEFMRAHGRSDAGEWYPEVDRRGVPVDTARSAFADFYALLGLAEYSRASGEAWARQLAADTFWRCVERMAPAPPYIHGSAMSIIYMGRQLSAAAPDPRLDDLVRKARDTILQRHVNDEHQAVFEIVWEDGPCLDEPAGRLLQPGHGVESMAFVIESGLADGDAEAVARATDGMVWALERGWDREYGGLFLTLDIGGRPPEMREWCMKVWWPHTESIDGLLLAYRATGRQDVLDWYWRVHDYTWSLFPDPEYGEWFGFHDRAGNRTHELKGGRIKGCMHVPRALLNGWHNARWLAERQD